MAAQLQWASLSPASDDVPTETFKEILGYHAVINTDCHRFVVVTGGPGSGKTTLLEGLGRQGWASTAEAGRGVIQDQTAIGGSALPWADPALFAELMLSWEMRSYRWAQQQTGVVLFDRGVPDVVGYLRLSGLPVPDHVFAAAESFRYRRQVLIAPPWPEIFSQDSERKQDFAEAKRTYDAMAEVYSELGYEIVDLPRADVATRIEFLVDRIASSH
ncbi:AAA family ATPase [Saccharopolyspora griseoalba]|uniref:AAA family ATPase n=1 Tax=Saccharopolyspora griseoalba TaxID=1431848 RepID=A0ABW2LL45_9PSEU